jgi:hypothetical protein
MAFSINRFLLEDVMKRQCQEGDALLREERISNGLICYFENTL